MRSILESDKRDLAYSTGGFWIDPWAKVETAADTLAAVRGMMAP